MRYVQLAHNARHPRSGNPVAETTHSFGREDQLDRPALRRLAESILRYLDNTKPADPPQGSPNHREAPNPEAEHAPIGPRPTPKA